MTSLQSIAGTLRGRGALLDGHFLLSSGRHGDRFIQKFRILEDPALVGPIGAAIADRFRAARPSVVVSAAIGGIVLGYEVARALGTRAIFVEKERGQPRLRRGFSLSAADRALVVEDVVTTGGSVREVLDIVAAAGAALVGIGAICNRGNARFEAPFFALLDMPMVSYEAVDCPLCAAGEPLDDPGSRRA
ncbi:MAG: orotate phosphoribosyltransferase [Candidatus Tyrphobacter sp.]